MDDTGSCGLNGREETSMPADGPPAAAGSSALRSAWDGDEDGEGLDSCGEVEEEVGERSVAAADFSAAECERNMIIAREGGAVWWQTEAKRDGGVGVHRTGEQGVGSLDEGTDAGQRKRR